MRMNAHTDVVVKAYKLAGELYGLLIRHLLFVSEFIPFPPFMMTHICEPTHLSMSSARMSEMMCSNSYAVPTERK